jgi:polar amino acid transport system substrate-binding protein
MDNQIALTPRRKVLRWAGLALGAALLIGCTTPPPPPPAPPEVRRTLAPQGTLRVGVYAGSPTSLVVQGGNRTGVAYELGRELARRLDVDLELVEYKRVAEVVDAMAVGEVDFTFTNATEARAQRVNFTLPMLSLELGFLVPSGSSVRALADVDKPGVRVGVSEGSSTQGSLGRIYRNATLVPVSSLKVAADLLKQGKLDAFATNKGILNELSDNVPGSRILEGRWGLEHMAIAIPKGRESALSYVSAFSLEVRRDGTLSSIVRRAGLRGTVEPTLR